MDMQKLFLGRMSCPEVEVTALTYTEAKER